MYTDSVDMKKTGFFSPPNQETKMVINPEGYHSPFLRPNKWRPRSSVWLDPSNLGSLGVAWVRGDHMGTYLLAGEHYWHCLRHFLDDDLDGSEKWGSVSRSTMINEYPWYGCYRWLYMVIIIYIIYIYYILYIYYIYTHMNILMILDDAFSTSYD